MTDSYVPPAHGFRTFVITWVTQSFSAFGSALTYFALNVWLTVTLYPEPEQKPQLAAALSAIALAFALPTVFGAPLAGAWADRYDRKRIMIAADTINGLLSVALALLVLTGALQLAILVPLVALSALVGAFHYSAFDTSYAMIVPEKQLPRANGMMQTTWALAGILSPGIAAAIIAVPGLARQGLVPGALGAFLGRFPDGTVLVMAIDAFTFFVAAATLLFLFIPSPKRSDTAAGGGRLKGLWSDVREGARFIWHRRPLLWLLGTFTMANLAAAPLGVFIPLLVKFNLAADWTARGFTFEAALALLGTVGGIGGIVGGFLVSAWGGLKHRRVLGVVVPILLAGLTQVAYGLSPLLFLTAAAGFVAQALVPVMNSHSQSIWQTQTPHELQGRVFAVRRLIAQVSWPLGTALAGWIGGVFDPGLVLAVLGAVLALFCLGQLFNPVLLRVEDRAYLDQLASRQGRVGGQDTPGGAGNGAIG